MKKMYKGWKFKRWCNLDPDDDRKINYTLKGIWEGKKQEAHFTSEDDVDGLMFYRIENSTIEHIELVNNEWFVTLIY
jgi:hypothetical protein